MRFAEPDMLWFLLALPLLALAALFASAARRRALERFAGGSGNLGRFSDSISSNRRALKVILTLLAIAATIVALARPQWGTRLEPVTRRGVDVVVVIDTSRSMAAEDVSPSRLGVARHAAASLIRNLAGDRIALVTFAGEGTLTCPLTLDHEAALLFLETVDTDLVSVQGSSLAKALRIAARAFGSSGGEGHHRAVVVLSDGEDHEGGIEEAIRDLKQAGASVFAVGCGTTHGGPIPVHDASGAGGGYKKDADGKVVTTRLDEDLLEKLALATDGHYYAATPSEVEVEDIAKSVGGMDQKEFGTVLKTRYEERYQIPLAVALAALLAETILGDRKRSSAERRRSAELAS